MPPRKKKVKVSTETVEPVEFDMMSVSQADICIAYKQVAATQEGQVVLADLTRKFGFTRFSTFVPGDPYHSQLNEGARTVVVHIGRMIAADPSDFEEPKTEM